MLPRTTKRRITTNLKSINNQKFQKIKLHGTPTTKELKKKINQNNQTGKADLVGTARREGAGCRALQSCEGGADLRGKLRLRADCGLRLWLSLMVGDTSSLTQSLLECALEWSRQAALFPLWPLPYRQPHSTAQRVALPG